MNKTRSRLVLAAAAAAAAAGGLSVPRAAAQQAFASPDEAVAALRAAAATNDKAAMRKVFGPDVHDFLTGDEAQDKANSAGFAAAVTEGVKTVPDGDSFITLEIGGNQWPFPIPLVKTGSAWRFDTAAGRQELVDRHVGKDELHAIGACATYVAAQKQYAGAARDASGEARYARKFKSSPGAMDGLYWKTASDQSPSPFGADIAAADAEVHGGDSETPKPFHGYYFRVLTKQGAAAPGGALDYIKGGSFSQGFALLAYPERWGKSGIMTFIVDQDGIVYQRNLGEKTPQLATALAEYNPDGDWAPVKDKGITAE